MSRLKQTWSNLSARDQLMLRILAAFLAAFFVYIFGIQTAWGWYTTTRSSLDLELEKFERYSRRIAAQPLIRRELAAYAGLKEVLDTSLLPATTPESATPKLNTIVKQLAQKNGVNVQRLMPRNIKEYKEFHVISVQFPVTCTTTQLLNFIYDIETHERLLLMPEITIRVTRRHNPTDIRADIVVAGLIRRPQASDGKTAEDDS
jgi:Tfp pilus assembly protein PilO